MERMSSTLLLFTGCYLTKEWSYLWYPLVTRFLSRRRRGWHWGSFLLKEIPMSCLELVTPTSKIIGHLLTTFIQMPLVCKTLSWTTFLLVMPLFPSPLLLSLPFYLLAWLFRKKRIRFGGCIEDKVAIRGRATAALTRTSHSSRAGSISTWVPLQ